MKYTLTLSCILLTVYVGFSQSKGAANNNIAKGNLYFYWGWNRAWYTTSTLHFSGSDYDFTLKKVVAKDRQTAISAKIYLNPRYATIPQYNFRLGYFFKNNWDISFGIDHMKYVMRQYQVAELSGYINDSQSSYNGVYDHERIIVTEDFLTFEHTDGLNYLNLELRHSNNIMALGKTKFFFKKGVGTGVMFPKTNTMLLGKDRYDEFHIAGFGISAVAGLSVSFFNNFYIQTELKGGYINLPKIRTTLSNADSAKQNFFFSQINITLGSMFSLFKK